MVKGALDMNKIFYKSLSSSRYFHTFVIQNKGFRGRAARQRSAKPPTPVRIWSKPRKVPRPVPIAIGIVIGGLFYFI